MVCYLQLMVSPLIVRCSMGQKDLESGPLPVTGRALNYGLMTGKLHPYSNLIRRVTGSGMGLGLNQLTIAWAAAVFLP